jgi:hypothetical protein
MLANSIFPTPGEAILAEKNLTRVFPLMDINHEACGHGFWPAQRAHSPRKKMGVQPDCPLALD